MKNFDNVKSQDYEAYMKAGICEFWAIIKFNGEDNNKIHELADKYNYGCYTTTWVDVYEMIKIGATFEDRNKQIQNENLTNILNSVSTEQNNKESV